MTEPDDDEEYPEKRIAISHRVRLLERDVRSHSRSITALVQAQADTNKHIETFEEFKVERLIASAREDERDKSLGDRLTRIEDSISKGLRSVQTQVHTIKAGWTRLLWIVIAAIVPAVLLGIAYLLLVMAKIPSLPNIGA